MMPESDGFPTKNRPCILLQGQKLPDLEEIPLSMVGTGTKCQKGGQPIPLVCPGCGTELKIGTCSCGHVECPTCWSTWAHRGSQRMAGRVWGYQEASGTQHVPRHVTFDLDTLDWDKAKAKALALGFTGGVLVPHPWRIRPECKKGINDIASKTHQHRYNVVRGLPDWRAAVYYSPHYHMIAYGKGIDVEAGSDEYVYKVIRKIPTLEDAQALAFYLLSHTHIPTSSRKATYRHFGVCTSQKLKPTRSFKRTEVVKCPGCGKAMVFPGTNLCKEFKVLVQEGWQIVAKSRRKSKKKLPLVSSPASPPAAAVVPCFYAEPLQIVQASPAR